MTYTRNSKSKNRNTRKIHKPIKGGDSDRIDYLRKVCLTVSNIGKTKFQ